MCASFAGSAGGCKWIRSFRKADPPEPAPRPLVAAPEPAPVTDTAPAADAREKDFTRLLLDRRPVPVTPPKGGGILKVKPPEPIAPAVIDQLCRLERNTETAWFALRPVPEPGKPPKPLQFVLFSSILEGIEPYADQKPAPILRVTGETTRYKRWTFVLLTEPPMIVRPAPEPTQAQPDKKPPEKPKEKPKDKAKTAPPPTTTTAPAVEKRSLTAEEIRQRLRARTQARPMPVSPRPRAQHVIPAPSVPPAPRKGDMSYGRGKTVVDRLVRLVPERKGGWLLARFESDNTLQQPPLRLLPCELLAKAERIAAGAAARMTKFRVSGLITTYKGRRYLLLRKLLRERKMDQF